jgi:uncharacterized protein YjeT (DUF2065 family)
MTVMDFVVALGLVFMIEGLLFAAFPDAAKHGLASVIGTPTQMLRIIGIGSAIIGLVIIWLVRG